MHDPRRLIFLGVAVVTLGGCALLAKDIGSATGIDAAIDRAVFRVTRMCANGPVPLGMPIYNEADERTYVVVRVLQPMRYRITCPRAYPVYGLFEPELTDGQRVLVQELRELSRLRSDFSRIRKEDFQHLAGVGDENFKYRGTLYLVPSSFRNLGPQEASAWIVLNFDKPDGVQWSYLANAKADCGAGTLSLKWWVTFTDHYARGNMVQSNWDSNARWTSVLTSGPAAAGICKLKAEFPLVSARRTYVRA